MARERSVQVVRSEACVGPSAGKNRLAEATSCEWVHFHDADDALAPEFVSRARQRMVEPDVEVVLFATEDREDGRGMSGLVRTWDDAALRRDPVEYAIGRRLQTAASTAGDLSSVPAVSIWMRTSDTTKTRRCTCVWPSLDCGFVRTRTSA